MDNGSSTKATEVKKENKSPIILIILDVAFLLQEAL